MPAIRRRITALLLALTLPAGAEPVQVGTVPLGELLISSEHSAPASAESLAHSRISAELEGVIHTLPVRVGDRVAAGELLVELDCSDYRLRARELRARLDSVVARVDLARRQLERTRTLSRQQTVSRELLDQREAELLGLQAEQVANQALLERAERDRDKCQVTAPYPAVVTERLVGPGEYVTPGTPLLMLLDVEQMELRAQIPATEAERLSAAEQPLFRANGHDHPLRLRVLVPAIDPVSRTREARLEFRAEPALPGTSGRLVWPGPPLLPAEWLVRRDGRLGILLAEGERARFHPLPDAEEGRPAVVDLPADTQVITDGRAGLENDQPISGPPPPTSPRADRG